MLFRGYKILWKFEIISNPVLNKSIQWTLKVGLSPSKKVSVICFIENPLKMMKDAFYFIVKALFILKIFKFSSWLFGHVEKPAWLER